MSSTMEIVSIESNMRKKIFLDAHNTRVVGSGSEWIVLGHGYGNDQSVWTHILPHLESNYKVVLYDLACAGSVTKNNGYDFEYYSNITAYVNDLMKILEYLEIDCCVYIGHSISAILGILGAIQHPELFSKLILLGASARYYNEEGYEGGFDKENIDNVFSAMRANYKAWVHTFSQNLIGSKDPTYPDYRDTLLSMGEDISIHISNVVFSIDLRKLLGQVKIPCSILQTWSDITVPMSAAKFLRDHLGGRTNLEILEVKGHLPHLTAPHLVVEKIAQALSTMFLDDFNVHVVGAGQRMLVLGHGMGSDQSVWHRILPFLEPNCRVVLYDLPCAGTVKRRCFDFQRYTTLEDYVDILFKILHALGIDVCVFVGHSVSAMIGILAARRCPTLFSKLILIGATPRFLNDGDYHGGCEQQDVDELFSLMKANWGDWVRLQAPLSVGCDLPEAVEEFYRTLSHYDPSIMMFAFRTILASDLREILGQVRVPCVIMQTNKDSSIPRVVAEFLREHLGVGDNLLVMLDTEGHLPQLTAPALLAQKLQEALAWW